MQTQVRSYIDYLYPRCAAAGSTEEMGEYRPRLRDGTCSPHTKQDIIVLDDNFTGVVLSIAMYINLPPDADLTPGKWIGSTEMEEAKWLISFMVENLDADKVNLKHAVARIFIGGDAVISKIEVNNVDTTIKELNSDPAPSFKQRNNEMARDMRKIKDFPQGHFRGAAFLLALSNLRSTYPGCTVWDEGPVDLHLPNHPIQEPTRVLVARAFSTKPGQHFQPDEEVGGTVYHVKQRGDESTDTAPIELLQNQNLGADHGGIIAVSLLVATPLNEIWPKCGAYLKTPAFKAAKTAGLELLKKWNAEGKLGACHLTVWMGADSARVKFFSEKLGSDVMTKNEKNSATEVSSGPARTLPSLDTFFIVLKEQHAHELFESEVQFQAIKQHMRQRMQEDPERFRAMAPQLAVMSANHFIDANFPDCTMVDEGEFPVVMNGQVITIQDTRLVVAKDPKKDQNSIVAAMHLVPLPGPDTMSLLEIQDRVWIGTPEMKAAEQALIVVLKQWYREGKLAEDCMAQVIMGTDATIYRFVDGERFEDYPDERMQQIRWG